MQNICFQIFQYGWFCLDCVCFRLRWIFCFWLERIQKAGWRVRGTEFICNPTIFGGATSFSLNVISSNRRCFAETKNCRNHLNEASHGRNVELAKLHNAERHVSESFFSRTSFSGIVVQPNVIFPNHLSAERHFHETSFARTSLCRTVNRPPAYTFVQYACRRAAIKLIGIDVLRLASKICVISNWVRVWTFLNMDTVRIRKVRNSRYGRFDLIVVFVPLNAISEKSCSAKRRFGKMIFG